jgi:photosystem II stability/assembly factor-like uncharacterized protein
VSGFDFGALRDPDAPQPDSYHRDGVEARAQELRAKARRTRAIVSALALAVVVAAAAGIVATRPDEDQVIVTDPSSTTVPTPSSIGYRFVPPTTTENGITTLPVTLPDGETFTMRYPEQMKIAQLGFAGSLGVNWEAETTIPFLCCSKQVSITYQTIKDVYGDATPVHVYRGPNGEAVPYFHARQALKFSRTPPEYDFLVFQFGPWLVQVHDQTETTRAQGGTDATEARMTETQRETWAHNLTGTVDDNGYLVLHAAEPLSIGNGFQGSFGDGERDALQLTSHLYCGQKWSETSVRRRFDNEDGLGVAWCAGDLYLEAIHTKSFVDLAATELQVSGPITETSTTSTTTTTSTSTPPVSPANAVSASFVSTDHGWLVESNGDVLETNDAGATWRAVGSLGHSVANMELRFADANRGFAVPTDLADQATTLTTDDGGVTWKPLEPPSPGRIYDLAISQGVVYLVAYDGNEFNLWSSPTDRLLFAKTALKLELGAGPVPFQQLVFSGGNGWVINENRTVLGGGRRAASGDWGSWNPPCRDVAGPARLAASSGTDLVASCDDHEWGGGTPAPAVYFSHDAGKTFQRHDAPAWGEIASPNATTAVVDANGVLRRTTDEGASWSVVAREPGSYGALDLGFTTSTQGFVIFNDGEMLMTHDAGATWSAVTLP